MIAGDEDYAARMDKITGGKGARITFDPIAGPGVETLASGAAYGGIIILYGVLSEQPTSIPLFTGFRKALTFRAYTLHEFTGRPEVLDEAKKYISDRLADRRFVPEIARTFPFEQTVEAYRFLESNQQIGKVVITIP